MRTAQRTQHRFFYTLVLTTAMLFVVRKNVSAQLNLQIDEFNIWFRPSRCVDTMSFKLNGKYEGLILKLFLQDCKGQSNFVVLDKKSNTRITGSFANGIDTLVKHNFYKILGGTLQTNEYRVSTIKFFYPLKAGTWCYYNEKKRLIRSENYSYVLE